MNIVTIKDYKKVRKTTEKIRGHFECPYDDNNVVFVSKNDDTVYQVCVHEKLTSVMIDLMCENVVLEGAIENGDFVANSIYPVNANRPDKLSRDGIIKVIHDITGNEYEPPCNRAIKTLKDIRLYYQFLHENMEHSIDEWFRNQLAMVDSVENTVDDRRQARYALANYCNCDFVQADTSIDIRAASKYLDQTLYGMAIPKQRVLEAMCTPTNRRAILLVGPPGTGKSALAKTAAECIARPTVSIDFSTLEKGDEGRDAITGTSRIFTNARAGSLLSGIFNHRSKFITLILQEIDKQPTALEGLHSLLDGGAFVDNYFELAVDNKGMFIIATANSVEDISDSMKSRFTIIHVDPYTCDEKQEMWEQFIWPKATRAVNEPPVVDRKAAEWLAENMEVRDLESAAGRILCNQIYLQELTGTKKSKYTFEDVQSLFPEVGDSAIEYNLGLVPGIAKILLSDHEKNNVSIGLVQAQIDRDSVGELKVIGVVNRFLQEYVKKAYQIACTDCHELKKCQVILSIEGVHASKDVYIDDFVSLGAYMAIMSALTNIQVAESRVFIGNVDLMGNLRLPTGSKNLGSILKKDALYGPIGAAKAIKANACTIIEAPTANTLFQSATFGSALVAG